MCPFSCEPKSCPNSWYYLDYPWMSLLDCRSNRAKTKFVQGYFRKLPRSSMQLVETYLLDMFVKSRKYAVFGENFNFSEMIQSELQIYAIHNALEFTTMSASKFSEDRRKMRLYSWFDFVDFRNQPVCMCLKYNLHLNWKIVRKTVPLFNDELKRIVRLEVN